MFACYGASGSSGLFQSCTSHSTLSYLVSHNFLSVSFDRNKHEMASPNATFSPAASSPSFDSDASPYSDDEFTRMELSSRGGTPASATSQDRQREEARNPRNSFWTKRRAQEAPHALGALV